MLLKGPFGCLVALAVKKAEELDIVDVQIATN